MAQCLAVGWGARIIAKKWQFLGIVCARQ